MSEHNNKVASEMRKIGRTNQELALRLIQELIYGLNDDLGGLSDTISKQEGIITATAIMLEHDPIPDDMKTSLKQTIDTHLGRTK